MKRPSLRHVFYGGVIAVDMMFIALMMFSLAEKTHLISGFSLAQLQGALPSQVTNDISDEDTSLDEALPGPFRTNLQRGERGMPLTVSELQKVLAKDPDVYPEGLVTGSIGTLTEKALIRFQMKYGVSGDQQGTAGPETRALLNASKEKRTAAEFNQEVLVKKAAFDALQTQKAKNELRQALQKRRTAMKRIVKINKEKLAEFTLPSSVISSLPADLQKLTEEIKTITGVSRGQHIDNLEAGVVVNRTVVETGEGTFEVSGYTQEDNTVASMRASGVVLDGTFVPTTSLEVSAPEQTVPQVNLPEAKIAVIMFLAADDKGSFDTAGIRNSMSQITSYFNEISYGRKKVSFELYGPYRSQVKRKDLGGCNTSKQRDEALRLGDKDIDFRNFTHYGVYTVGCIGTGYADGTIFRSNDQEAAISLKGFIVSSFSPGHVAHEIGHTFGPGHASTLTCGSKILAADPNTCTHSEYGDPFDVMGSSGSMGHMNALHKAMWGALQQDEIMEVVSDGTYTLTPLERAGGIKALEVVPGNATTNQRDPQRRIWIEFRQPIGTDAKFGGTYMQGAFLRATGLSFVPFNGGTSHLLDATPGGSGGHYLPVGQSFVDPHPDFGGYRITPIALSGSAPNESLTIKIEGLPPPPAPLPMTFDVSLGATPASVKPGDTVSIPFTINLTSSKAPVDAKIDATGANIRKLDGTYTYIKGDSTLSKTVCRPTCTGQLQIKLSPQDELGTLHGNISVFYLFSDVPGYEESGFYSRSAEFNIPITKTPVQSPPPPPPPPPSDTIAPILTLVTPVMNALTNQSALGFAATATDNVGISKVVWKNETTGIEGIAQAGYGWVASVPLTEGQNTVAYTAYDAAGNMDTKRVAVTRDSEGPKVEIISPTKEVAYIEQSTSTITVIATSMLVENGQTKIIAPKWKQSFGSTIYGEGDTLCYFGCVAKITLKEGFNVITMTATDSLGNRGEDTLTVFYFPPKIIRATEHPPEPLTFRAQGPRGAISSFLGNVAGGMRFILENLE